MGLFGGFQFIGFIIGMGVKSGGNGIGRVEIQTSATMF
jgi:hypothetical protein